MNEREFCYWLQGLFEVAEPVSLNETQTAMIRDHLKLVFTKVTPARSPIPTRIYDNDAKKYRDMVDGLRGNHDIPLTPFRVTC